MDPDSLAALQSISNSIGPPSVPRPLKKLYRGEPMALGITQIIIGILEIAFGVVIAVTLQFIDPYSDSEEHGRTPYWMGILYIISGSLSVAAAKKLEVPLVKGMLGMNVVSAVAAGITIVILSISLRVGRYYLECDGYHKQDIPPEICRELYTIPYAQAYYMTAVLLAFTVLEFFITIVTAAYGCAALCRQNFSETTIVVFQNAPQGTPPAALTPVKEDEVP